MLMVIAKTVRLTEVGVNGPGAWGGGAVGIRLGGWEMAGIFHSRKSTGTV